MRLMAVCLFLTNINEYSIEIKEISIIFKYHEQKEYTTT